MLFPTSLLHPTACSQQMQGRLYRCPPIGDRPDFPMPGFANEEDDAVVFIDAGDVGGILSLTNSLHIMPRQDAARPTAAEISALASLLPRLTSEEQRSILGEELYPLVDQLEHDNAPKVTGMILELSHTTILHLLGSPEALQEMVDDAMEVLRSVGMDNGSASQSGSLSPRDNSAS